MYCVKMESSDEEVTFNTQELIIRTRLAMEPDFQEGRKKKRVLWSKVLAKIKETRPDFEMNNEQISRKFLNFMTTYRRIKDRNNKTGRNATSWEFFDIFDEVYGKRNAIKSIPSKNLRKVNETSLKETKEMVSENEKPHIPAAAAPPPPPSTERCEDVIFGELVSAMLKRMEEDKKKNIKKEIMNLLCS